MIEIDIPGYRKLQLEHMVLDHNGTLACDGMLLDGVADLLRALARQVDIHVLTADTFGKAAAELQGLPVQLTVLPVDNQDTGKRDFVNRLGAAACVAIGNGRNDKLMLESAVLGIAVCQQEGASGETLLAADVVCPTVTAALELLLNPRRLVATLRS